MKLAIIDDEGIVHVVTEDIETYDLSKPFSRANVIEDLRDTLRGCLAEQAMKEDTGP